MNDGIDIASVVIDVLERLAMTFADEVPTDEIETPAGEILRGEACFDGDASGRLEVVTTLYAAREMAASILGVDATDPEVEDRIPDALSELINVMTGQLLTEVAGVSAVFDMTPPSVRVGVTVEDWVAFAAKPGVAAVLAAEGPLMVGFEFIPCSVDRA